LECLEDRIEERPMRTSDIYNDSHGRGLFENLRKIVGKSEDGAGIL